MPHNNPFYDVDRETVLSPKMLAMWDRFSMGVVVLDANGICCYMNKVQRSIDGFTASPVVGMPVTQLYLAHEVSTIPSLEVLRTGLPMLKKAYWYKTVHNQLVNSVNDFFPLFKGSTLDGLISFTTIIDVPNLVKGKGASRKELPSTTLFTFDSILGEDGALRHAVREAQAAATSSVPVMIWGESGSGKELFAQAIHMGGMRAHRPFIPINCAAIPENLLESMLFGTVKGSYTDATEKAGLFEEAHGGTLVFDELNSMPMGLQAKLLRVIQEKKVRRLGSHVETPIDVRIISILNEHPLKAMEQGLLRRDLYYRLAVVGLSIPPLRQRRGDILPLARYFLRRASVNGEGSYQSIHFDESVENLFLDYTWPGNIRELQHAVEGALALHTSGSTIYEQGLPRHFLESRLQKRQAVNAFVGITESHAPVQSSTEEGSYYDYRHIQYGKALPLKTCIQEYEERCIRNVLRYTGGNVAKAARILEMTPSSLHYRIKSLGIEILY